MRETIRVWLEWTEIYVLEVILERRRGKIATIVRGFLNAMSKVYGRGIKARRFLHNLRKLRVKEPFGKREFSFWKVLLVVLIITLAGIILAILISTGSRN